jgi:hypothetical protein
LMDKIEDIKADPILPFADLIIFGETWLESAVSEDDLPHSSTPNQQLPTLCQIINKETDPLKEYTLHLNSNGRGKGLATYYMENKFLPTKNVTMEALQVSILESENLCVITLYRSRNDNTLGQVLQENIPAVKNCLVIGDFNICSRKFPNHEVFAILKSLGFKLLLTEATHFDGGHLDQAWLRVMRRKEDLFSMELYSPYYNVKDHDALLFTSYDPSTELGKKVLGLK